MAKGGSIHKCSDCGYEQKKWTGQCRECKKFGTMNEIELGSLTVDNTKIKQHSGYAGRTTITEIKKLKDVQSTEEKRFSTGFTELDNVLGGGLIDGAVILVGGDPGIGKSTLLSQVLSNLSKNNKQTLYVTGEESASQIKLRTERLMLDIENISILTETNVEKIISEMIIDKPSVIIVDSIQTMFTTQSNSSAGSITQVKESTQMFTRFAKENNISIFIVGHITKDGTIAGPKILEHIVDTVLYFEGEKDSSLRIIRSLKNRFGEVNEIGVFSMQDIGLKEVKNPSAIFLTKSEKPIVGSVILITRDGTKNLLIETQSLVAASSSEYVQRKCVGVDRDRVSMMIAILQKKLTLPLFKHDIFVSVTGGIKISETAGDLSIVLSILSSYYDRPINNDVAVFGEVGLSGEVRPVRNGEDRIKEALKQGMTTFVIPKGNEPKNKKIKDELIKSGSKVILADSIEDLLVLF